jgi:ketosteroid isomerase-like protein
MSRELDAAVFRLAVRHWTDGDLEGVLSLIADDIVHVVNVDALEIPWVSSAEGKPALTARLMLIAATFDINAFIIESLVLEKDDIRATVLVYHTHKKTRERLDIRVRFRVRVKNGLIVRMDEFLDAAYIDAFNRFVKYLEETAQAAGGQP